MAALRTRPSWLTAPVLSVSVLSIATGLAQFSVTAVIGDVAAHFGAQADGSDMASQLGMPATTIGLSLALVRLAGLASLPVTASADRLGRRRLLLLATALGLGATVVAALAPGYWFYVALVALARPLLSSVNALAGVIAAEETGSAGRSAAIAVVAVGYGLGSGLISVVRGALPGDPSFRVVSLLVLVPLLLVPLLARRIREPAIAESSEPATGLPGSLPAGSRARVLVLALMAGLLSTATGPGFTYLFVYGEGVLGASPATLSLLVLAAGPAGLLGLLLGRWGADRIGRRITGGLGMALTGAALAVGYAGQLPALAAGYLGALAASTAFAPPEGTLTAELVPTRARATAAGWITVAGVLGAVTGLALFGVIGDVTGDFTTAARGIGALVAVGSLGFCLLPETRGLELDAELPSRRDRRRATGPA